MDQQLTEPAALGANPYLISYAIVALMFLLALVALARLARLSARRREVLRHGEPAVAVVLERDDVGPTVGGDLRVALVLDVLPADGQPFRAAARAVVPRARSALVQPGVQVLVRYDPHAPAVVELAGLEESAGRA